MFVLFRHQNVISTLESEKTSLLQSVDAQALELIDKEALLENLYHEVYLVSS
jgi:hypothetical protein